MSQEKIYFDKWLARPYSILQVETYNNFLTEMSEEVGTIPTYPIFIYNPDQKLVYLYYNMSELIPAIGAIGKKITADEEFKMSVYNGLMHVFFQIKDYFDGKKEVSSIPELEIFFKLFTGYMKYVAYTWILPGLDFVPQQIKDEAMILREKTESYAGRRDSIMVDFAKKIINDGSVDPTFLTLVEVKNLPDKAKDITTQRSKGFLFYKGEIVTGDKIKEFCEKNNIVIREPEIQSQTEVKGMTAQKGVVRGKVRVIYTEEELGKIKTEEDILVTPMTRPEFVPAIKIAGAFVTDEGGIVCHAAIISRELKKPCIVGTKNATKIFKDGDLVEVDADNGMVKIL